MYLQLPADLSVRAGLGFCANQSIQQTHKESFGEMDAICENRWNLPKVLALAKENMCCVWVQHRGRMQGVEEDDEKFKEDFKILNFLWFSILFGNTIFSFHSHPLFIVSSPVFLKGLGNLKRN